MVLDSIQLITERSSIMFTMLKEETEVSWVLSPKDRCDQCGAEALVQVTGINGDLLFCGHHYNKIMDSAGGYKKMMSFAITILDEREKLVENRAKGDSY
jgi:hypothetical protein